MQQIPTPLAMEITGVDSVKFREAVSRGHYVARGEAVSGKARLFDEPELEGLFFFGELLRLGFPLPLAASRASAARDVMDGHPNAKQIWISFGPKADSVWVDRPPPGDRPLTSVVFHVSEIRTTIDRRIREHVRQTRAKIADAIERADRLIARQKG